MGEEGATRVSGWAIKGIVGKKSRERCQAGFQQVWGRTLKGRQRSVHLSS